MIVPNDGRILVELLKNKVTGSAIILPETNSGQGIGENLQLCKVIHPGLEYADSFGKERKPRFKEGQLVAVMEYSLTGIYKEPEKVPLGEVTITMMLAPENKYYLVSVYDVMGSIE